MEGSEPVHVLHFFHKMVRGGAETFAMNIFRNIDREKVMFDFAVTCEGEIGDYDEEIRVLGGKLYYLPKPTMKNIFHYIKALDKLLKTGKFRCIHSHLLRFSGLIVQRAFKARIPVRIAHSHSTRDGKTDSPIRNLYRALMRWLILKYSTNLFSCGNEAGINLFGSTYTSDQRSKIIYNSVDTGRFSPNSEIRNKIRNELQIRNEDIALGLIGRFITVKNHIYALEILKKLLGENSNYYLYLIGDGELKDSVKKQAENLNIDAHVKFLGVRTDVDQLMQALDGMLVPSLYEGFPVVLVEAQVAGLPAYVSDRVSRETDLGLKLIEFMPIDNEALDLWAKKIKERRSEERFIKSKIEERLSVIKALGFDAQTTGSQIFKIYGAI